MTKKQPKKELTIGEGSLTHMGGTLGKPITLVRQVCALAEKGKSVWHARLNRTVPAAWLQNMPASLIVGYIRMGWLYEYRAKSREKTKAKR